MTKRRQAKTIVIGVVKCIKNKDKNILMTRTRIDGGSILISYLIENKDML